MSNIYCSKTKGMYKWYILLGGNGILMKMVGLKNMNLLWKLSTTFNSVENFISFFWGTHTARGNMQLSAFKEQVESVQIGNEKVVI